MIDFDCCWPTEQAPTLTFNVLKKEAAVPAEITIWSKTFFKNFLLFDWSLVLKTSLSFYFVNFYDWFRLLLAYWTGPYPWFQRFEKRSSRSSRKNDLVDDLFSRILDPRTHLSLKFYYWFMLWLIYFCLIVFAYYLPSIPSIRVSIGRNLDSKREYWRVKRFSVDHLFSMSTDWWTSFIHPLSGRDCVKVPDPKLSKVKA